MTRFILCYTILFFLMNSCDKEIMVQIDSDLQIYVDQFVAEGLERGHNINLSQLGIDASIENIEGSIVGQCQYKVDAPNVVLFDREYWSKANEDERLFIVFHELGHCILSKEHNDQKDQDGFCKSIMHSSTETCNINFNSTQRAAYFDELFSN